MNAAKKAKFVKKIKASKTPKTRAPQKWYTRECKEKQKILRKISKELSLNPFDKSKRHKFVLARSSYKKVCRKAESIGRRQLTNKLIEIGKKDPKQFWDTIKKMNNWGKEKSDLTDNISIENWIRHFNNLLNSENAIEAKLDERGLSFDPALDGKIDSKELREARRLLKMGKSAGPDKIIGEYLNISSKSVIQFSPKKFIHHSGPQIF